MQEPEDKNKIIAEQQITIAESHIALNSITSLFCAFNGYQYSTVNVALQALKRSGEKYNYPIRAALAERIEDLKVKDNDIVKAINSLWTINPDDYEMIRKYKLHQGSMALIHFLGSQQYALVLLNLEETDAIGLSIPPLPNDARMQFVIDKTDKIAQMIGAEQIINEDYLV